MTLDAPAINSDRCAEPVAADVRARSGSDEASAFEAAHVDRELREPSPIEIAPPERTFRASELRRVGIATTMIVVCGTIIILATIATIGHYNPLVHCTPVSIVQGAAIALLLGRFGRWRCLALLGTVYGLVLLMQVGLVYLLPITALAGAIGAGVGRAIESRGTSWRIRTIAVCIAAALFVLLSGFGTPIKIYFGTGGNKEPFVWALWFAEWPLRIGGAIVGAVLARRWLGRRAEAPAFEICGFEPIEVSTLDIPIYERRIVPNLRKAFTRGDTLGAAVRISACIFACIVPLAIQSAWVLGALALAFVAYALWAGLRKQILHVGIGLAWGWLLFGLLSYAWHRDVGRVIDLARTFVLRFAPMMLASIALVATIRPVDVLRLLRKLKLPSAVLLPLSTVVRTIPRMRRTMKTSLTDLRSRGEWHGPLSIIRRPRVVLRALLIPHVREWASELAREREQF